MAHKQDLSKTTGKKKKSKDASTPLAGAGWSWLELALPRKRAGILPKSFKTDVVVFIMNKQTKQQRCALCQNGGQVAESAGFAAAGAPNVCGRH